MRSHSAGSETSPATLAARPPAARISSATPSTSAAVRAATSTAAPSRANRSATARPIPRPPPVTIARCSLSSIPNLLFSHRRPALKKERHPAGVFPYQHILVRLRVHLPLIRRNLSCSEPVATPDVHQSPLLSTAPPAAP